MVDYRRRMLAEQASLRRRFVTPEGVDLKLELGTAGARAGAFVLDMLIMLGAMILFTLVIAFTPGAMGSEAMLILWLVGTFVLRNGWFILFEMGSRGATLGKRIVGLRVVARDGQRLTGGAVVARNAMREIEVFLPISFFFSSLFSSGGSALLNWIAFGWAAIFLFFPLFNRDRLRVGDLLAGTWVVKSARQKLAVDLGQRLTPDFHARHFSDAALNLYGEYELQALEDVLRTGSRDAHATVAAAIRQKAGLPHDGDDYGFLMDYYAALCGRLERGRMLGRVREDKFAAPATRPEVQRQLS